MVSTQASHTSIMMLRAVVLLAAGSTCGAFRTATSPASAMQGVRAVRERRSVRASAVAMGDYSLDNMVLDGPLLPLRDQVRSLASRAGPAALRSTDARALARVFGAPHRADCSRLACARCALRECARARRIRAAQVLVKLADVEKQTKGGLFLTGEATDKPTRGTVVAAGPGKPHPYTDVMITNPIQAGDTIIFGTYTGTKVKYCKDDHVMLTMDEVLAKVTDKGLVPIRDRAMLKPIEKPVETSTGIVLTSEASKAQEVPNQGEVIGVGEGRFTAKGTLDPVPLQVGDKVMYTKYGGVTVDFEGQKVVFVFAADCLAKY